MQHFKFGKIITAILLFLFMTMPVMAQPLTLWEFYDSKGLELPSVDSRSLLYRDIGSQGDYRGTMEQNIALLGYLLSGVKSEEKRLYDEYVVFIKDEDAGELFGGAGGSNQLPQISADFESSLVSRIERTDTSMTLVDSVDRDGNTLSGWYGFIIDITSTANRETVIANCTGSSCTGLLRGVSYADGISTSTTRTAIHRRGASISLTNHPNLTIITRIMNGLDGVPDKMYYDNGITITAGDNQKTLVDLEYTNTLVAQGVATSTTEAFGGGKVATKEHIRDAYTNTNDPRFITTNNASSTRDVATTTVVATDTDGYINQEKINLIENWDFSGGVTMASTTITGTTTLGVTDASYPTASSSVATRGYVDNEDPTNYYFSYGDFNGSGADSFTHGLGKTPDHIKVTALGWYGSSPGTQLSSTGIYNGSSYNTIYLDTVVDNSAFANNYILYIKGYSTAYHRANVTTFNETTITLTNTTVGSPDVTHYLIEAWAY